MITILFIIVIGIWALTLIRIVTGLVSSDIFTIKQTISRNSDKRRAHLPTISVLIPAYNEERTIERALLSIINNTYPKHKIEVIIANDGSTDSTEEVVRRFRKEHASDCKIRLINRENVGKAKALNYVLRRCARGSLIMCLDADSFLDKDALRNAAQHFRNRNVIALCSNVNVLEDGTMLGLAQRIEYLMGFHIKKGLTQLGINYIIGGTGSMFRRSMLKKIAYYEGNTLTEDLDLTMKIIATRKQKELIAYAHDAITYTEAVHSLRALMQQRFRWMYGRAQVFLKYSSLFFSTDKRYPRRLTWVMLPLTLLQDIAFFLAPLVLGYLIYNVARYGDLHILTAGVITIVIYLSFSIWSSDHLTSRAKARLIFYAPPMYLLIYLTTFADYYALMRVVLLSPRLRASLKNRHITWRSPERKTSVATSQSLV